MTVLMRARFDRLLRIDPATASVRQARSQAVAPTGTPTVLPQSPWRRAVDIGVALAGLGVTTLALLPIAIAIKLESPGPIFTREICCGYMGQQFSTWRFRTSRVPTAPTPSPQASPPVTPVGKVLRYLRLDKLPLFWNVLVGEMRLTGGYATRSSGLDTADLRTSDQQFMDRKPGLLGELSWVPSMAAGVSEGTGAEDSLAEGLMGNGLIEQPIGLKVLDEIQVVTPSPDSVTPWERALDESVEN
jgi:lipopolysaccharide/colanic/teichoic acid biosynthesis glycosyltransferase